MAWMPADYQKVEYSNCKMAGEDRQGLTVLYDPTVHTLVGEKGGPLGKVVFE